MAQVGWLEDEGEPLSAHNFERLTQFIKDYCGINITEPKRTMLEGRIRRRLRATGFATTNTYCDALFDEMGPEIEYEVIKLIDAVTTNKTDFFREPAHFDYLCRQILPTLAQSGQKHIKIWSAACSIGAEPYTLAMLLDDFCLKHHRITYSILATDICIQSLEKAVTGCFPETMIDPVPSELRRRYVMRSSDPSSREVRMSPKLRSNISFARLNLMDDRYPIPKDYDVIFLRNVLIYFDKPTQAKVPMKLSDHLREGGHLVLGHSESSNRDTPSLHPVANTIYQKR